MTKRLRGLEDEQSSSRIDEATISSSLSAVTARKRERQLERKEDGRDRLLHRFDCLTARHRPIGGERMLLLVAGGGCKTVL